MWIRSLFVAYAVSQAPALLEPIRISIPGSSSQVAALEPPSEQRPPLNTATVDLPSGVDIGSVEALEVSLTAENVKDRDGFYIRFFALVPREENQDPDKVALDTVAVFRPLREGDVFAGVVHQPPAQVWVDGKRMTLGFDILPATEGRIAPRLDLRIDAVELIEKRER